MAKVVSYDAATTSQVAVYQPPRGNTGDAVKDLEAKLAYITETVPLRAENTAGSTAGAGSGEFHKYRASRRRDVDELPVLDAAELLPAVKVWSKAGDLHVASEWGSVAVAAPPSVDAVSATMRLAAAA